MKSSDWPRQSFSGLCTQKAKQNKADQISSSPENFLTSVLRFSHLKKEDTIDHLLAHSLSLMAKAGLWDPTGCCWGLKVPGKQRCYGFRCLGIEASRPELTSHQFSRVHPHLQSLYPTQRGLLPLCVCGWVSGGGRGVAGIFQGNQGQSF